MAIFKTLEQLAQDPTYSADKLTSEQKDLIITLKQKAAFINANLMIADPDDPDDNPRPTPEPDDK